MVYPRNIYLGQNEEGKDIYGQYIPIIETLRVELRDDIILNEIKTPKIFDNQGYRDYHDDGHVYKTHFKTDKPAIDIILYRDDLEIVNPIGTARIKHKVAATYFSIGNLSPAFRSRVVSMYLVSLCKTNDLKAIKDQNDAVGRAIMEDLCALESNGIQGGSVTHLM